MGAGHAASLAMRAVKKGLIKARAIAAVAPTWAGPMPIVFGREPDMESRLVLVKRMVFSSISCKCVFQGCTFLVKEPFKHAKPHYLFNKRLALVMM